MLKPTFITLRYTHSSYQRRLEKGGERVKGQEAACQHFNWLTASPVSMGHCVKYLRELWSSLEDLQRE